MREALEKRGGGFIGQVPNALSIMRIPLSLTILFVKPFSSWFFAFYIACGATDALDGYVARKYHVESALGAKLDSAADFTFFAVALYIFLTAISIPPLIILWAFTVITVRFVGLASAFTKFHSWPALHTYAYKVVSFVFFCFPVFYMLMGVVAAGTILCSIATLATAEEIYINRHSPVLDLDIKGITEFNRKALP